VSAKFNLGTARQWWPVAALYSVSAIFDETELTRVNDQAICRVLEAAARRDAAPPEIDHHRKTSAEVCVCRSGDREPGINAACRWMPDPMWAICERVAEVQALLDDHIAGGKHSAADVLVKAQAILAEPAMLRAMFDVGYFPPNTPPAG
jgi:hypothetical protein